MATAAYTPARQKFPAPAVMAIFARFDRQHLSAFMEVAVELIDAMDGDPDLEPNGDELDGNASEDDFMYHGGDGPGCPIADPANVEDGL